MINLPKDKRTLVFISVVNYLNNVFSDQSYTEMIITNENIKIVQSGAQYANNKKRTGKIAGGIFRIKYSKAEEETMMRGGKDYSKFESSEALSYGNASHEDQSDDRDSKLKPGNSVKSKKRINETFHSMRVVLTAESATLFKLIDYIHNNLPRIQMIQIGVFSVGENRVAKLCGIFSLNLTKNVVKSTRGALAKNLKM